VPGLKRAPAYQLVTSKSPSTQNTESHSHGCCRVGDSSFHQQLFDPLVNSSKRDCAFGSLGIMKKVGVALTFSNLWAKVFIGGIRLSTRCLSLRQGLDRSSLMPGRKTRKETLRADRQGSPTHPVSLNIHVDQAGEYFPACVLAMQAAQHDALRPCCRAGIPEPVTHLAVSIYSDLIFGNTFSLNARSVPSHRCVLGDRY